MKKAKVTAILNHEIVERFSNEEMMVLVGGVNVWALLAELLLSGANIGYCREENTNCVEGCACTK